MYKGQTSENNLNDLKNILHMDNLIVKNNLSLTHQRQDREDHTKDRSEDHRYQRPYQVAAS